MRILIIRPGAIGDTLLTFPIIQALRTHYHDPHITLVGNPAVLPLALSFRLVEEVSDYGQLQWSECFSTLGIHSSVIRNQLQQTDLAICWLRDPDGLVEQNLHLAGVKRVVVAAGRPPGGKRIHIVEYLAGTLGLTAPTFTTPQALLPIHGYQSIGRNELHPHNQHIAIHPGSGGVQKCWPALSFAAVIERLWQRNCFVLLLAGPADHQRLQDIQSQLAFPVKPGLLKVLIDAPLVEVAQHLQQCSCYLGNDSGITHLAAMLGIPTIALFGPTDPATWRPLGPAVEVLQEPVLEYLPVELVLEKLSSF